MLCWLFGHQVDRTRIWHDNFDFRGYCARCGQTMIRDVRQWRLFDEAQDGEASGIPRLSKRPPDTTDATPPA